MYFLFTEKNIFNLSTPWTKDGEERVSKEYLKQFTATFEKSIWDMVEQGVKGLGELASKALYQEVLTHSHRAVQTAQVFTGQTTELNHIHAYLKSTSNQPLVVHGEAGCGKTALLAKAALEVCVFLCVYVEIRSLQ